MVTPGMSFRLAVSRGLVPSHSSAFDETRKRGAGRGWSARQATPTADWLTPGDEHQADHGHVRPHRPADELAVLDPEQQVLGVPSEAYATRRYAEETGKRTGADLVGGELVSIFSRPGPAAARGGSIGRRVQPRTKTEGARWVVTQLAKSEAV